ncbi:MAG: ArnT family glycosyltransferase [Ardenticatenaceae bacterium]
MDHQTISRLLRWLALAGLALFLLFWAFRSWNVLLFPHQVEYGEGPVLDWAGVMAKGGLPYQAIESFPWSFSVYTPGYLAASALLIGLFPDAPWFGGRLLSLVSALFLAQLLLFLYPRQGDPLPSPDSSAARQASAPPSPQEGLRGAERGLSKQKASWLVLPFGAWLAPFLWLASPYLFRWATFYRPDLFALLWSALGIVIVQRAVLRERQMWLIPAAGCFVLSFWSKQSFFAAPLASMIYLWLVRREWLPRLVLAGALGGALVAILLGLMSGRALFDNLIAANANPFSWQALWRFERSFFTIIPIIAGLALWQVLMTFRGGLRSSGALWVPLLPIYAMLSLLVTLSVGKAGAWENYFLEPLWVLCALAGQTMSEWLSRRDWRALAVPVLVLLQLMLFLPGFERLSPTAELAWLAQLRAENVALHATLDALPPDALVWSEQMGVLAEKRRIVPLHSFVYTQLEHQGLWDPSPLNQQLSSGEAALLIQRDDAVVDPLHRDRWSRLMLDASERGYTIGEPAGRWRMRSPLPFPGEADIIRIDQVMQLESGIELVNWMAVTEKALPLPVELVPNAPLTVHLLWRTPQREQTALTVSVQLFAPDGSRVAQDDLPLRGGLSGAWRAGTLLRDEHTLELPDKLAAGAYTLQISLYESQSGTSRGTITLPRFKVSPPPPNGSLAVPRDISFADTLRLLSHDALPAAGEWTTPGQLLAGDTLALRVRWLAQQPTNQPLTAFLHLIAPDGTLAAQTDFPPPYPPHLWSPGEEVELTYTLQLPQPLTPATYQLRLGWYHPITFQRLPAQGQEVVDGALRLGQITVP